MYCHISVLLQEVIKYLSPKPGQYFVDCTLGGGGHALELAKQVLPNGKILGLDLDPLAIENTRNKAAKANIKNLVIVQDNFKNLEKIIRAHFNYPISGLLLDLGLSSALLETSGRGFSFQKDEPLDMRFNPAVAALTAKEIINAWPESELVRIFQKYGEEPKAKKIAQAIVAARRAQAINTTFELSGLISKIVGHKNETGFKIKKPGSLKGLGGTRTVYVREKNPATRAFQALRLAVNNEFENLKQILPQVQKVLEPGARLAVISFHSLEDRIVKDFFRAESRGCLCPPAFPICCCGHNPTLKIITKKPVAPSIDEVQFNPRSRSAKLRVAEKI